MQRTEIEFFGSSLIVLNRQVTPIAIGDLVADLFKQRTGDAMRSLGATAVALVTLFIVDQFLNAGRYSEVVASVLVQAGSVVRVRV
jgi:hypothetical protein